MQEDFDKPKDDKEHVVFMWGLTGIDKQNTEVWNRTYAGELTFDPNFSIHSVESQ